MPFTSSISILSVASLEDSRSLGEGEGSAGVAAILMKRWKIGSLKKKKKRVRNRREEKTEPSQKTLSLKGSSNVKT